MTRRTLLVTASPHRDEALGSRLARKIAAQQGGDLLVRDLAAEPLAPLTVDYARALTLRDPLPRANATLELSERLVEELESTDRLIIATPMHNFGMPAALKLWVDYVLRIHRTFAASPQGKVGLLADRATLVIVSSGGFHRTGGSLQPNYLTPHLEAVLNTLGIRAPQFVYLEGLVSRCDAPEAMIAEAAAAVDDTGYR
ncbi:flavodoxin family protein [Salinicola endophyticus]|uniref:FMN dependent NADH:quinone oxidoreductase n=1 Tax=Salinicola endophyticus TaxID=1949083 RepID=A0ABY8FNN0_9GAMM|nr:NAD(P)H-dependent oxidoreductase [Salinicola endophyticus]WFF41499.1 flavodoxin family protein [Salinicola endophyticus]